MNLDYYMGRGSSVETSRLSELTDLFARAGQSQEITLPEPGQEEI